MNYNFFNSGTSEVSQNTNAPTSAGDSAPRMPQTSPVLRKSAPTPINNSTGFQELYFPSTPQSDAYPDYPVKSTKPSAAVPPPPAAPTPNNEESSQISQLSKEYNTNLDLVLSKPEYQRNVPMFYLQEVGAFSSDDVQAALRKKVDKETKAMYGPPDDAKVGEVFTSRSELYKVHSDVVNDVCSSGDCSKPATSVIIYDGEEHDDRGNMVLFVGEKITYDSKETLDEPLLEGSNLSLSRNSQLKIPIRLIRAARKTTSAKSTNPFAPMSGYRYDGVYFVGEYWFEKSPFSQDWVYVFKFIRVYGQPTLGSFVHFPISRKDVSIDLALGNAGPPSMKTNAFPSWSEVFSKPATENNLISTYAPDESGKQKQKANNTNNQSDLLSLGGIYTTSNPIKEPVNSLNKVMDNVTGFKMPDPQGNTQPPPSNPYSLPSSYVNPSQFSTPYIPLPPTMSLSSTKPPSPAPVPAPTPSSRPPPIAPKPSSMPPIAPMPQQQPPQPPQPRPLYPKPPMQPNYSYPPAPPPQQAPAPQYNPPQYMQMPPPPTPTLPNLGLPGSGRISDLKNVLSHDRIQDMLSSLRQKNSYQPRLDVPESLDAIGRPLGGESAEQGNNSAVTSRNKQFFWNLGDPLLDKASMSKKSGTKRKKSASSANEETDYSSSGSASSSSPSPAKKKQKKTHKRPEQQQSPSPQQHPQGASGSAPVDLTTSPQNPQ